MTDEISTRPPDATTPIGEHGVIGDMETLALIGHNATIEWLCWPRFDSPSVFGSLLDPEGGQWQIAPTEDEHRERRLYLPGTNILISRFHLSDGVVEIEDCMLVDGPARMVLRCVSGVRGTVTMRSECRPRPDYGRADPGIERRVGSDGSPRHRIDLPGGAVVLSTDAASTRSKLVDSLDGAGCITHEFEISEGERVMFALAPDDVDLEQLDGLDHAFEATIAFWHAWSDRSTYRGRWRTVVERSALTLKLLTHRPSGGLIAAATTSLPETLGGERNWDYRYVWIRDAAFALYAFMELGYTDEAAAFTRWLQARVQRCRRDGRAPLRPLYDIDGNADLDETEIDHWSGYADSRPVRVGNAAADQLQLDIYGELIDSLYLADKRGGGLSLDAWNDVRFLADWVCDHWDQPDDGFWEVRNGPHEFTASRLMCWVALERAIRMARFRGRPADLDRWQRGRDEIHACIMERGWSTGLEAFTQTLDGDRMDASLLLMPLVKFISSDDPKWTSTLAAIGRTLSHDALVERYEDGTDGMEGDEGTFTICTFWYVEALARAGQVDRARLLFDKVLSYASPLGIFSETISDSGEQLGNFPQAFTHLALISAAVAIDEAEARS